MPTTALCEVRLSGLAAAIKQRVATLAYTISLDALPFWLQMNPFTDNCEMAGYGICCSNHLRVRRIVWLFLRSWSMHNS
jgi:hypothetical protein